MTIFPLYSVYVHTYLLCYSNFTVHFFYAFAAAILSTLVNAYAYTYMCITDLYNYSQLLIFFVTYTQVDNRYRFTALIRSLLIENRELLFIIPTLAGQMSSVVSPKDRPNHTGLVEGLCD